MTGKKSDKKDKKEKSLTKVDKKRLLKRGRLEWGLHMTKKQHFAATMIQRKFRAYRMHMEHREARARVRSSMQRIKQHHVFFDREYWERVNLRDLKRAELEDLAFRLELPIFQRKKEVLIQTIQRWIDLRLHVQDVAIEAAMPQGCVYVLPALPQAEPWIIRPLNGRNISTVAAGYESEALYAIDSVKGIAWLCKTSGLASQIGFCSTLTNQDVFNLPYQTTWLANPMPMQTLRVGHIEAIHVAHSHALARAKAGEVYSWGSNPHGQLGIEKAAQHHQLPLVVETIESYVTQSIGVGAQHSAAVCDQVKGRNGVLFAWGSNSHCQLGLDRGTFKPTEVTALSGLVVRKVACGTLHTVVVTDQGDVFSWGCNDGGRLAHGINCEDDNIIRQPRKVQGFSKPFDKAIEIACGPWHTAALMVERLSQQSGVVGQHQTAAAADLHLPLDMYLGKRRLWSSARIEAIDLLTPLQLGQGSALHATQPQMVPLPPMKNPNDPRELVKAMACGLHHVAALTENGNLYTWGSKKEFSPLPHKLPSTKVARGRIVSIACGGTFTAFCIAAVDEQLYEPQHRHLLWHTRSNVIPKLDFSSIPPLPLTSSSHCIPRLQPEIDRCMKELEEHEARQAFESIDLNEMLYPRCRLCWRCPGFKPDMNKLAMCRICRHRREHHGKRHGPMSEYEAVRKLQSKYRQRQGVKYLHQLFLERVQRVFSIRHDMFFYYNTCNRMKSWTKPRLLPPNLDCPIRDPDDEIVRPPYTIDDAASVIQGLFRARKARKLVHTIQRYRYETCVDANGRTYYRDRRTNAVRWDNPFKYSPQPRRHRKPMTEAEATATLQRCVRGGIARKQLRKMLQKRFKALIDSATGATYYFDAKTKEVSWTKPRFFVDKVEDSKPKLPKYTDDSAASALQRIYRGRRARRRLISLLQARYQQAWDPKTQKTYFINTVTKETKWEKPALLQNVDLDKVPVHHKRHKKKAYNMSDVDAAIRLQAVLRAKIKRRRAQKEVDRAYERVWDSKANAHFYHNKTTKEVTWTRPPLWDDALYEKLTLERPVKPQAPDAKTDEKTNEKDSETQPQDKEPEAKNDAPESAGAAGANTPEKSQRTRRRQYTVTDPDEAARIIQAALSRNKCQTQSIKSLVGRFQKVYDPNTHRYFYYDQVTKESTWTAPLLLKKFQKANSPTKYKTPESAAVRIQGIFRLHKARQEALQLAQASYEKVFDETIQAYYYFNTRTGESQWTKPKCFRDADAVHVLKLDAHGKVVDTSNISSVG
ncbi:unnamed protein product [Aphanomyces euteiches]